MNLHYEFIIFKQIFIYVKSFPGCRANTRIHAASPTDWSNFQFSNLCRTSPNFGQLKKQPNNSKNITTKLGLRSPSFPSTSPLSQVTHPRCLIDLDVHPQHGGQQVQHIGDEDGLLVGFCILFAFYIVSIDLFCTCWFFFILFHIVSLFFSDFLIFFDQFGTFFDFLVSWLLEKTYTYNGNQLQSSRPSSCCRSVLHCFTKSDPISQTDMKHPETYQISLQTMEMFKGNQISWQMRFQNDVFMREKPLFFSWVPHIGAHYCLQVPRIPILSPCHLMLRGQQKAKWWWTKQPTIGNQ